MTPEQILAVPLHRPDHVFQRADLRAQYRRLAAQLHPDRAGGNDAAFAHMEMLYKAACDFDADENWPGLYQFTTLKNKTYDFKYLSRVDSDTGSTFVGREVVAFAFYKEYRDLFERMLKLLEFVKFPTPEFAKEGLRFIPASKPVLAEEAQSGRFVAVYRKKPTQLLLRDVIQHHGGKLKLPQFAWIVTSLLNLNCVLAYGPKYAHGDVSINNYYVDLADHSGVLLGGWAFAQQLGQPWQALPAPSAALVPRPARGKALASPALAGALVRAVGRQLLGDAMGSKLLLDKSIPGAILVWLRSPASEDPVEDYRSWEQVLKVAYGKRVFHKAELSDKELYPA